MPNYTAAVFDLDGTLLESGPAIIASSKYMLEKMGLPPRSDEELAQAIGLPITVGFMDFIGISQKDVPRALEFYREHHAAHAVGLLRLFPGIIPMLDHLRAHGIITAIATCKVESVAIAQLTELGLTEHMDLIAGAAPDQGRLEKAEVLQHVIDTLHLDPKKIAMIGDRKFDLIGANALGVDGIGVLYGYGTREELLEYHPKYIVDTISDLEALLLSD